MDLTTWDEIRGKLNFGRMGKPAFIGIAAALIVVAVVAGRLLVTGTATANEFEIGPSQAASVQEGQSGETEPETAQSLYVHVSGAVVQPGLVKLEAGARVADAIDAAGGLSEDASPDAVNLARELQDGEQLKVPTAEEARAAEETAAQGTAQLGDSAGTVAAPQASDSGKVNINTASASELAGLPGIGESLSQRIVSDRSANGPFKSCDDLKRVSGIGDKKYEALSSQICV